MEQGTYVAHGTRSDAGFPGIRACLRVLAPAPGDLQPRSARAADRIGRDRTHHVRVCGFTLDPSPADLTPLRSAVGRVLHELVRLSSRAVKRTKHIPSKGGLLWESGVNIQSCLAFRGTTQCTYRG